MYGYVYYWYIEDEINDQGLKELKIRAYILDEKGKTHVIHITRFQPWIYLEIKDVDWMNSKTIFKNQIIEKCKILQKKTFYICYRKKLYYWQDNEEKPFFKIRFQSIQERKNVYYQLHNQMIRVMGKKYEIKCHEYDVPCLLQFLVSKNLPSAGWIEFRPIICKNTITDLNNREYEIDYEDLKSVNQDKIIELGMPDPYVLSFDLEVYSSNSMRMPDAKNESDCIFQISCCIQNKKEIKKILLTLGKIDKISNTDIIFCFENEKDLLLKFKELVKEYEINICIGYNIFGFDIPYMIERSKLLKIYHEFDIMGFPIYKHSPEKTISWSSKGYSYQEFHYLETEGRLWIDLLPVIRREYKFSNYKLKTVSTYFLGETKDPLTARDIFKAYEEGVLEKKKEKLRECGKYCIQDSLLVLKLYNLLNLWIGLSEMAKICNVPIMHLFTKGQQIKVYSQLFQQCYQDNRIVESVSKKETDVGGYTGAFVFPPEPGIYEWVVPFDFSSLYPTTIIAYNIDYSTLVKDESKVDLNECHIVEWDDHINCEHDINKKKLTKSNNKMVCKHHRYVFKKEPKGVMPRLLIHLLEQRAIIKKKMKEIKNDPKKELLSAIYDKQQLAYKLSANSAYGIMGFQKGYVPLMEGAMSVTAMGRMNIQKAAEYVKSNHKGQLIYGDSVVGDTPITLKNEYGRIEIKTIEKWFEIYEKNKNEYPEFEKEGTGKEKIEMENMNWNIMSLSGWTRLKKIIRHWTTKKLYRIWTTSGIVEVTEDHSLILKNRELIKPKDIKIGDISATFNSNNFFNGDLLLKTFSNNIIQNFQIYKEGLVYLGDWKKYKIELQYIYLLLYQKYPYIECRIKDDKFHMIFSNENNECGKITNIECIGVTTNYVYDIETKDGSFHAGIGNLIVKNTDSIYCHFSSMEKASLVWNKAKYIETELLKLFPSPMKLVFEDKLYQKFLILTKKRYMAYTCDDKGIIDESLTIRGVLLARRDNCKFIRDFYEHLVRQIMDGFKENDILNEIVDRILALFSWDPIYHSKKKNFVVSKIYNKDYKNKILPVDEKKCMKRLQSLGIQYHSDIFNIIQWNKDIESLNENDLIQKYKNKESWLISYLNRSKPAHVQLAMKCNNRGFPIEIGSRIEYLVIEDLEDNGKLFDKLEDPDYFYRHRDILRIDRYYYLKLLSMPVDQLLEVSFKKKDFVDQILQLHYKKRKILKQLLERFQPILIWSDDNHKIMIKNNNSKLKNIESIYDLYKL